MKGTRKARALAGTAVAAAALTVAISGSANASTAPSAAAAPSAKAQTVAVPDSPGRFCGTYGDGYTNQTVWHKKPPGCHDFNITWARRSGDYAGFYWNGSQWREGHNGYRYRTGGRTWDQAAVTNVATGTPLYVGRSTGYGYNVHVNY